MAVDENTRLDLRQAFEDLIGPHLAHAAMEAMPNIDYADLATKADLAELRTELQTELGGRMGVVGGQMAELRGDMAQLRGEMAEMRGDLRSEMAANLRIMVMAQIGTAFGLAGLMVGLG